MSATLDAGKFQNYFDSAPLLVRLFLIFEMGCPGKQDGYTIKDQALRDEMELMN